MAVVGTDGNDLPELRPDGVNGLDWANIAARIYTDHGREPYRPEFGIGVAQAHGNPIFSPEVIQQRFRDSLDGLYLSARSIGVTAAGGVYRIDLDLEV